MIQNKITRPHCGSQKSTIAYWFLFNFIYQFLSVSFTYHQFTIFNLYKNVSYVLFMYVSMWLRFCVSFSFAFSVCWWWSDYTFWWLIIWLVSVSISYSSFKRSNFSKIKHLQNPTHCHLRNRIPPLRMPFSPSPSLFICNSFLFAPFTCYYKFNLILQNVYNFFVVFSLSVVYISQLECTIK